MHEMMIKKNQCRLCNLQGSSAKNSKATYRSLGAAPLRHTSRTFGDVPKGHNGQPGSVKQCYSIYIEQSRIKGNTEVHCVAVGVVGVGLRAIVQ